MEKIDPDFEGYLKEQRELRIARGPLHNFPAMAASERLDYEALTLENCRSLLPLFKDEESRFVDERYRSEEVAVENARFMADLIYDAKHGGCDFLLKLKGTQQFIGVLHLFDYCIENFLDNRQRCSIGYAIGKEFRRQFYATEAVKHLIGYAHSQHGKTKFLAYTSIENGPSNKFLQSLNFRLANEDYYYGAEGTDNFYVFEIPEK